MLFADDTNVLLYGKDVNQLKVQSKNIMTKLYSWLCSNKLTLNVAKTNYCIFGGVQRNQLDDFNEIKFGKQCIKRVENVRYLGLHINEKLDWKYHVEKLSNRLIKTLGTFKFIRLNLI